MSVSRSPPPSRDFHVRFVFLCSTDIDWISDPDVAFIPSSVFSLCAKLNPFLVIDGCTVPFVSLSLELLLDRTDLEVIWDG